MTNLATFLALAVGASAVAATVGAVRGWWPIVALNAALIAFNLYNLRRVVRLAEDKP